MKLNVIDDKGAERVATIVTAFRLSSKKYIIYSFFEEDNSNSTRIYISELRIKQKSFSFNNIINDNEWDLVKRLMKELARGTTNLDEVLVNFDVEVISVDELLRDNEYSLATIKDSKVVKVSSKFIEGLIATYNEMVKRLNNKKVDAKPVEKVEPQKTSDNVEDVDTLMKKDDETKKKMKDIWEYSSMLQKKIAKDMRTLNSKVVKLNGSKYYVDIKDPLYLKEKIELQIPEVEDEEDGSLSELEPVYETKDTSDDKSIFSQLEKELSGINDNFNKIVAKNQEEKAKIASEIEKRLKEVAAKEKELVNYEEKLKLKEEELKIREDELVKANQRLEEDIKSLTKYASMINSMMTEE